LLLLLFVYSGFASERVDRIGVCGSGWFEFRARSDN
jgi:hypothetical protein